MNPEVSIILPSLNRSKKLVSTIKNLQETCPPISTEIIVVLEPQDYKSRLAMDEIDYPYILDKNDSNAVKAWNYGASVSTGDWLFIGSDDVIFPPDWLTKCLNTPNKGFVGITDGRALDYANFYMATRSWLKENQGGVLCVPHYRSWGLDPEICERAKRVGHYVIARGVHLAHNHPAFGTAKTDATYRKASKFHKDDIKLFYQRAALGYPNDFEGYL